MSLISFSFHSLLFKFCAVCHLFQSPVLSTFCKMRHNPVPYKGKFSLPCAVISPWVLRYFLFILSYRITNTWRIKRLGCGSSKVLFWETAIARQAIHQDKLAGMFPTHPAHLHSTARSFGCDAHIHTVSPVHNSCKSSIILLLPFLVKWKHGRIYICFLPSIVLTLP